MQTTLKTMKKLTRIKLVNWHYFSNETININGSCLISGENASGKSTVLDAIQLILTTNTKKFNPAANEKSKRDLKGYVRCKTGEEGNTYARKNSIISYVALEFYEESKDRFFVLGAKFDSPDEESEVRKVWFCEEGSLDDMSFVVDNKPATDEQFKNNGKKITFIRTTREAKGCFKHRLGNLDDNFFDMIPKSLAFKPMDNVRRFITQFILPERPIEVETLRENIRHLREMQLLIEGVRKQINQLQEIIEANDKINETRRDILIIDILLKIAEIEDKKKRIEEKCKTIDLKKQDLHSKKEEFAKISENLVSEQKILQAIQIDISNNTCSNLIEKLQQELQLLEKDRINAASHVDALQAQLNNVERAFKFIPSAPEKVNSLAIRSLERIDVPGETRNELFCIIKELYKKTSDSLSVDKAEHLQKANALKNRLSELKEKIEKLHKNQIPYQPNTIKLQKAIETEFESRAIASDVRVFADLLEITEPKWQNAVEGYLNTQRFNIIVEPRYYDVAAEVYDRLKSQIEGVTLVNTQALDINSNANENTLASVVSSENRYARAYANYLMGRVMLCESVSELKQHSIAITATCMLYQGKGLRKIPEDVYKTPFIGKHALKTQLELAMNEFELNKRELDVLGVKINEIDSTVRYISECNFGFIESYLYAPVELDEIKKNIIQKNTDLKEAQNDPNIMALHFKEKECKSRVDALTEKMDSLNKYIINLERDVSDIDKSIGQLQSQVDEIEKQVGVLSNGDDTAILAAQQKFTEHNKTKEVGTIYENQGRRKSALITRYNTQRDRLIRLQTEYKDCEYGTGEDVMNNYTEEYRTLSTHDLIEYEEKLNKAKADCELEFRESFLADMKTRIEDARDIFLDLNKSLKNIYYGNDSYRFHCSAHQNKRGFYEMFTSDVNVGGLTLFADEFETNFHDEMETLFSKLTESDERGDKTLLEYTDYREYLDYDIEIITKDGKSQLFSKIYGEKSGGETQTPYYVAIAASFAQIYNIGETIKIIMLDEAFDKMDDERIASMMQFFRSQNFQVILATPPAKIETVGEYVDTVLVAYRNGYSSIIEEYNL